MSRWLKSVNNLLDNLDGQAENVAEGVGGGIDNTFGQLLEKGQQAAMGYQGDDSFVTDDEDADYEDGYSDDEDEAEEPYSSEDDDIEEEDLNDESGGIEGTGGAQSNSKDSRTNSSTTERLSIGGMRSNGGLQNEADSVSDISFTERSENSGDAVLDDDAAQQDGEILDKTPNPPNRIDSFERSVLGQAEGNRIGETKFAEKSPGRELDVSPRQPRRSLDRADAKKHVDQVRLEQTDTGDGSGDGAQGAGTLRSSPKRRDSAHSADPPKLPTRQSSLTRSEKGVVSAPPSVQQEKRPPHLPPPKATLPEKTKEEPNVQKLKARLQQMQEDLNKAASELKTSKAETKKLDKQVKSLEIQLETANSEIHAQAEELRRAGERMEKDRKLAQDEREELLDEQDEEVEQLKELHATEVNDLKSSYERQINELTKRLQVEESLRMQEGGDWTKELEDAVARERDALKQLNEVTLEKSKVESSESKLKTQHAALQTKLASALQSVKEATEREREVEDKLDAALSLHARQLTQRQTREAELEKTIFELGSALTVAQQKQQKQPVEPRARNDKSNSYKEKLEAAEDEAETLKVQLNFETQRREALQQELNEISKERSEEISSAQARQQQHDRKVAAMESTIARLKKSLQELKAGSSGDMASGKDGNTTKLDSELSESKQEIARLSDQLLRHQRMAETSKSEILALKGRLQSATARAEQAESSLVSAQTSSDYVTNRRGFDVEGGGLPMGNTRRRVKGGGRVRGGSAGRSIRSALNIGPGRTNYAVEQAVVTIDALDKWMVETGSSMRHEPFARLGFLVYLMTLHLWTFALVVFHTVEVPHGDFGSMDSNPRHWRNHA
eukprot:scaffold346_cov116-Cylindrotheca_fusiformis.AAC.20